MSRLQKKCLFATAGFHLLLLVILLVGPAFFTSKPKPDDSHVLDVIPANILDNVINSGVRGATPPPPTPTSPPQPPAPAPTPTPARPEPAPVPQKVVERAEQDRPVKNDPVPVVKPTKTEKPKIKVNLKLTEHVVSKSSTQSAPTKDDSAKQERAVQSALRALRHNLSSATSVDMPGDSTAAYADYASVVKSIYEQAWMPPDNAANDNANTKVRVTISSDGTVISAHIISPSGDSGVDATVQRTLNRVSFIAPFPAGTTDKERTYIINFNLKAKRMLG